MSEVEKTIGQLLVNNLGVTFLVILFILSGLFKLTKREIDPIGKFIGWVGKKLTKDVRKDVSDFKQDTENKFEEIRKDREVKIDELKSDYNTQIIALKKDLDGFEKSTNASIREIQNGTVKNCETLKQRLDEMEVASQKSNDIQTIRQIRAHILDFANSCMNKRKHTKRDFENIIDENTQYEALVKKYGIKNNVYKEDYDFIMKVYHRCQEEGTFLNENDA